MSWFKPFAYGVYAINSLILLLVAVDYLLCEVDLFGIVWLSSTLLIVTLPIGLLFFIYSLFCLRHKEGRCIAIWTAAMVLFFFVVFWLLPSGSSRVAAKMEKHCLRHEEEMLSILFGNPYRQGLLHGRYQCPRLVTVGQHKQGAENAPLQQTDNLQAHRFGAVQIPLEWLWQFLV